MRVLNKKYWPYQINAFNHKDMVHVTDVDPREVWCSYHIKPLQWKVVGWNPTTYAFKYSDDALAFKLANL